MKECNHRWYHPFNILTGVFVSYAYKCRLCDEVIISDNGAIPELEEKISMLYCASRTKTAQESIIQPKRS